MEKQHAYTTYPWGKPTIPFKPPTKLLDPAEAIKRDMQRASDALLSLSTTLQKVTGKSSNYPQIAPVEESLREVAEQMIGLVDKADNELMEAARKFIRYDISFFFKSG